MEHCLHILAINKPPFILNWILLWETLKFVMQLLPGKPQRWHDPTCQEPWQVSHTPSSVEIAVQLGWVLSTLCCLLLWCNTSQGLQECDAWQLLIYRNYITFIIISNTWKLIFKCPLCLLRHSSGIPCQPIVEYKTYLSTLLWYCSPNAWCFKVNVIKLTWMYDNSCF